MPLLLPLLPHIETDNWVFTNSSRCCYSSFHASPNYSAFPESLIPYIKYFKYGFIKSSFHSALPQHFWFLREELLTTPETDAVSYLLQLMKPEMYKFEGIVMSPFLEGPQFKSII